MKMINVGVRPAESSDLKITNTRLRFGQPFLVLNEDEESFSGFHIIDENTNIYELSAWYKAKRVYVPLGALDQQIKIIKNN